MKIYLSLAFDKEPTEIDKIDVQNYIRALQYYYREEDLKILYLKTSEATGDQSIALKLAIDYMTEADLICFCPYYDNGTRCNRTMIEYQAATTIYQGKMLNPTLMQNILADYVQRPTVTVSLFHERFEDIPDDILVYAKLGDVEFPIKNISTETFKSGISKMIINLKQNDSLKNP